MLKKSQNAEIGKFGSIVGSDHLTMLKKVKMRKLGKFGSIVGSDHLTMLKKVKMRKLGKFGSIVGRLGSLVLFLALDIPFFALGQTELTNP